MWHKHFYLQANKLLFHEFDVFFLDYYFTVWLEVLGTKFSLKYMDRDDVDTKNMEIELLNQVYA